MSGAKEDTAQHDNASEDDRGGHTALPDNAKEVIEADNAKEVIEAEDHLPDNDNLVIEEVSFSKNNDIFKNILCFRLRTT